MEEHDVKRVNQRVEAFLADTKPEMRTIGGVDRYQVLISGGEYFIPLFLTVGEIKTAARNGQLMGIEASPTQQLYHVA